MDGEHLLDGPADAYEHDADARSLHEGVLHALVHEAAANEPYEPACDDERHVDESSQPRHRGPFGLQV